MLSYAVYISTEVSYADPGSALPKYSHKHSSFDYCQVRYAAILQKKRKNVFDSSTHWRKYFC